MTQSTTAHAVPSGERGDADRKEQTLLTFDQAMFATASRYDLDDLTSRTESHRHLVRFFMNLVRQADADLFIEAGAKEAWASRQAKKALPNCRVVAFEANPFTFRQFVATNAAAGVEYLNSALTTTPGPVSINVHRDERGQPLGNGQASLLQRDKEPKDRERGFHQVTVDGVALDQFLAEQDYERAAIWVDVEGACKFVLSGAPHLLAKTAVAMVEVEDAAYWGPDHWLREHVVSYLYDFGLVPVARDFENVNRRSSQYNIVFVQEELLHSSSGFRNELARFRSQAYYATRKEPPAKTVSAPPPQALPAERAMGSARNVLVGARARVRDVLTDLNQRRKPRAADKD
jgi:FkbM family methyltransferase